MEAWMYGQYAWKCRKKLLSTHCTNTIPQNMALKYSCILVGKVLILSRTEECLKSSSPSFTNLLFSPPGLLGRASISIGPQAAAATGLTTGTAVHALRLEETWRMDKHREVKIPLNWSAIFGWCITLSCVSPSPCLCSSWLHCPRTEPWREKYLRFYYKNKHFNCLLSTWVVL